MIFLTLIALILLFFQEHRGNFIPSFFLCLLFILFCTYKIHSLVRSRTSYRRGDWRLQELDEISGLDFEELTCDILAANGFELAQNTPSTGDFGVDVLAFRDGISFAIQCKRYHSDVGIEAVQQVYAGRAYYECHVALVFTNQYFTPSARELADKIGVVLWDRDMLKSLL
jgi:HJR/Mrr/RecB family endonuclease